MPVSLDSNGIWIKSASEGISYPEEVYDICFAVEDESFWFKHRNHVVLKIIEQFPFRGDFLDIGGGNGFQLKFLSDNMPENTFTLIEPGYSGCLNAKKRGLKNIYNIQFQDFPFEKYDVGGVGLFDVLEHVSDEVSFIGDISTRLKRMSTIYITVPSYTWLWSANDINAGHFRRYDRKKLSDLAQKLRLKVLYNGYFFFYLVPAIFLSRTLSYKLRLKVQRRSRENTLVKHSPNKLILPIVDLLNTIELRMLTKRAVRFGTSCIAVFST